MAALPLIQINGMIVFSAYLEEGFRQAGSDGRESGFLELILCKCESILVSSEQLGVPLHARL